MTGRFGSDGTAKAYAEGQLVTGYIDASVGDTFTVITDKSLNTNGYTGMINCYDSDKAHLGQMKTNWTLSDDGLTGTITIHSTFSNKNYDATVYARFCIGYTDINNIIITKVGVEQSGEVTETVSTYYADGYRLPANDAYGLEESAGATATMDIDITHAKKPITFNLTGIQWWDILENPNCLIGLYGHDEYWMPHIIEVLPLCSNTSRTGLTVSGNYFNVTITLDDGYMDNVTMVRFSGIGVGEDAKITMTYTK